MFIFRDILPFRKSQRDMRNLERRHPKNCQLILLGKETKML